MITPSKTIRQCLERAVALYEAYGLVAGRPANDPLAAGRWINEARAALAAQPAPAPDAVPPELDVRRIILEEIRRSGHAATPPSPKLCTNCAPDGQCMKRQALCEFTGTAGVDHG